MKWQKSSWKILVVVFIIAGGTFFLSRSITVNEFQQPEFLTFNELRKLSKNPHPGGLLELKLNRFWRTPIISNEAYRHGTRPHSPSDPRLGHYLRLVSWNIEKSIYMENAIKAFSAADRFSTLIDPTKVQPNSSEYQNIMRQRDKLSNADIIVLQEMDIGVKRSGYINAAGELAKALDMNYAYGAEQLEIDPIYLGLEKIYHQGSTTVDQEATDFYTADSTQYKGVFGCAVLSRY